MALDVTLSGPNADSYATLLQADDYFANHFHVAKATAWASLGDEQKEAALKAAANALESLPFTTSLIGKAVIEQRLSFPRNIDFDTTGAYYIPSEVRDAQCEQAIYMVTFDESALASAAQGLKHESIAAGPVRQTLDYTGRGSMIAPMAYELLRKHIKRSKTMYRA